MRLKGSNTTGIAFAIVPVALLLSWLTLASPQAQGTGRSFCNTGNLKRIEGRNTGTPREAGVVLAARDDLLVPRQVLAARLVNRSRASATYGVAYRVDRFTGGSWHRDPSSPKGPWPKKEGRLKPGSAGTCFYFRIPAEQPNGKYRIVTFLHLEHKKMSRSSAFRIRSAE